MCTLCDSTNINTIIEFVPHVSGDGSIAVLIHTFSYGIHTHPVYPYLQFRDTHAPCLLKLCTPPSNGIVRRWLFPEFVAELPLDNCTPTNILNNPVFQSLLTSNEIDLTDKCRYNTWNSLLYHTFSKVFRLQLNKHQVDGSGDVSFGTAKW